jgi:hypothetical protein
MQLAAATAERAEMAEAEAALREELAAQQARAAELETVCAAAAVGREQAAAEVDALRGQVRRAGSDTPCLEIILQHLAGRVAVGCSPESNLA